MPLDRAPRDFYASKPMIPKPPTVLLLAGGQGSRLRDDPEFSDVPKVLITDHHGDPIIAHALDGLERHRWGRNQAPNRVAVLTSGVDGAGGAEIERYLQAGGFDLELQIFQEIRPLGTAGAVYAATSHLPDATVIVAPADTLFPYEVLSEVIDAHHSDHLGERHTFTWAVTTLPGPHAQNPGRLRVDGHRLLHTGEHDPGALLPDNGQAATSAGLMVISTFTFRAAFADYLGPMETYRPVDLYRDLMPWLLDQQHPVHVFDLGSPVPDLGTPDRVRTFWREDR